MRRLKNGAQAIRVRLKNIPTAQLLLTLTLASALSVAGFAQAARKQVQGVQNFGQVTDQYFRGGAVTPEGVDNLAAMGVRTIIDLRDKPSPGEPEACQKNGVKYHKFGLDGSAKPDDKIINEILSIVKNAKEPIYVHCSAGKHRAGTIAALYRLRVQGWSPDQTWAEQQSYGFGPAEEHPELYSYVYGERQPAARMQNAVYTVSRSSKENDDEEKSKKSDKIAKSKKDDDDEDDDDAEEKLREKEKKERKSKKKEKSSDESAVVEAKSVQNEPTVSKGGLGVKPAAVNALSADASIITIADAIKRAQAEGGTGDVLKVDLEFDQVRSITTYDVTFATGNQYELDAVTGKYLGVKTKAPAKLAVLTPLASKGEGLLSFQEIIRKAEAEAGNSKNVMEMELKRIKGRNETRYEVVMADGTAIAYDASTGKTISDL